MATRGRTIIKKLAGYLMIELFLPGGTVVILGLLFFGGSFPGIRERVWGMLPRNLNALIRPAGSAADQVGAHSALTVRPHPTEG